ncbi:peptidase S8/S53 [Calothrix parasitica NIES-267]|uniref:Peptidase S8/S53 n=1 Tax=Calothrix parasitica NIES-267 TaxID=1973488 RepID=A0A1Z4LJR3_9CYAN|nr:peptidase S8/S53 [Calothrix parasitica NIES-267]
MNHKRTVSGILLASSILAFTNILPFTTNIKFNSPASAQTTETQTDNQLFYIYKGKRIPLTQQKDVVAVEFKALPKTRSRSANPLYLQLEKDLQIGTRTRGGSNSQVQVQPLGESYAVVTLPGNSSTNFQKKIQNQKYVKTSLPVLTRTDSQDTIVLPNEIVLSFKPNISDSEKQSILRQNNLEIVRPLRFFPNVYIVKSTTASGTAILNVANQLNQIKAINSASPNFLQSISNSIDIDNDLESGAWSTESIKKQPKDAANSGNNITKDYLGLQWHLNSVPLKQCLQQRQQISSFDSLQNCLQQQTAKNKQSASAKSTLPRTDLRVTEAWKNSNGGKGVVVAVIDSLIQYNHPDLRYSLYKVEAPDKCPLEEYGWDFSEPSNSKEPCSIGDSDTRMSPLEVNILRRKLQDTFKVSDKELIKRYVTPRMKRRINPSIPEKRLADYLRNRIRSQVGGEFHGTLVSGVIAAKPQNKTGIWGVAPNAKILPVRVFGLNGSIFTSSYIEAVGYAANRGADVINLSLGAMLPSDVEELAFNQILQQNPKLVVVASSGNSNYRSVAYPSGYEGVLSVGASNLQGNRAPYSNFGKGLDVIAPGGDLSSEAGWLGGIPTTGGTWMDIFWRGLAFPKSRWSKTVDYKGKYWWMEGTSFSSPAVAGVVALMKGEDTGNQLNRVQLIDILKSTAGYQGLNITEQEQKQYRTLVDKRAIPDSVTDKQFFFGSGLINASAAVRAVKK